MTESERALVKDHLSAGQDALLGAVRGLSITQATFKPAPDRWSILACLEHVAVAEGKMLRMIERATDGATPSESRGDSAFVAAAVDRTRKFMSPDPVKPAGRFSTLEEALQRFTENRERTLQFVEQCAEDLRRRFVPHPIAGPIDGYRCLLLIAAHPSRHAAQIKAIRQHPAFPRE